MMKMKVFVYAIIISVSLGTSNCSSVIVVSTTAQGDLTITKDTTLHRLFLGYVANNKFVSPCDNLQRVEVRTTIWQGLITAVTLGIYAPAKVRYICAVVEAPELPIVRPPARDTTRR